MKKEFFAGLLIIIISTCTPEHEPTLNELVVGTYESGSSGWFLIDTNNVGHTCGKSIITVQENQQGLLDVKATCSLSVYTQDTRDVKNLAIRETTQKNVSWLNPGEVLYEFYDPISNQMKGAIFQIPSYAQFNIYIRSRTVQRDSILVVGQKRYE